MRPSRSPAYALSGLISATRSHTYTFTAASTLTAVPAVAAADRATNVTAETFRLTRDAAPPEVWLDVPRRIYSGDASIPVTWGATDDVSGVAYYDLDARIEDGEWQRLLTHTQSTSCEFTLPTGSYFTFRVTATDNVGNQASAETSSHVARVRKYYYHGGRRVAMRAGGVVYYLHGDHLGSVSLATNAEGGFHSRQLFLPYGDTRWQEGALPTDFGFGGQRHDSTGLVFMHARYYHAYLNRFTSPDPIVPDFRNPQSINRYAYAFGNPINYIDPSGHMGVDGLRAQLLQTRGLELHDDSGINAMSKFIQFTQYAASLYSDFETTQYVIDVTAVIHGHEYDLDSDTMFWKPEHRDDHSSEYWLHMGAFDQEGYYTGPSCRYSGFCDEGWREDYRDDTGNQVYHFWFFVAVAYFDGPFWAIGGGAKHELEREPPGSWQDFLLGIKGAELGSKLADWQASQDQLISPCLYEEWKWAFAGVSVSQVPEWLISHLWDGTTSLQLQ